MKKLIDVLLWLLISVMFVLSVFSVYLGSIIVVMLFSSIIVFLIPLVRRVIFPMMFKDKDTLKLRTLFSVLYVAIIGTIIFFILQGADFSKLNPYTGSYKFKKPARYFDGTLTVNRENDLITMEIATNAPDNALFELSLVNDDQKVLSSVESVLNGRISKEFTIPEEWGTSLVLCNAVMPFNFPSIKQPDAVKKIYGNNGSKMDSPLAEANNLKGFNGVLRMQYFTYPDNMAYIDKAVKKIVNESELLEAIYPEPETTGWSAPVVVFSAEWSALEVSEKKQICKDLEKNLKKFLKQHTGSTTIVVTFKDNQGNIIQAFDL